MRLGFRLLLGFFLIVGLAAFFVLDVFVDEIKPGVRQASEDSLVDTANVLAEMAVDDLRSGHIADGRFSRQWAAYRARSLNAVVWGFRKEQPGLRVYITDTRGIVLFDSEGQAQGQDYSRWNDVYLTLRGQYGVRTTTQPYEDGEETIMHVAAPVRDNGQLLGVLTVARSNRVADPFIQRSQAKIMQAGGWMLAISLAIGVATSLWLTLSVRRLVRYADAVSRGERVALPSLTGGEIRRLGRALESMRIRLEGRQYVEHYVTTLTHEMKSPLAAIQGAAELLDEDVPAQQRQRFVANIREQASRLYLFIDRMLALATVEQRQRLDQPVPVDLSHLAAATVAAADPAARQRGVELQLVSESGLLGRGDPFLLRQALSNLLDNAIDFSTDPGQVVITVQSAGVWCEVRVRDQGAGIPDYAIEHIFDRFYSLPRPAGGRKSTGLGLSFVREVMLLHGGEVSVANAAGGGVEAVLRLPVLTTGAAAGASRATAQ